MDNAWPRFRQLLCPAALGFSLVVASAQTWTGATGSDWNTAANWSTGAVPTSSNGITLNGNGTNAPVVGTANATILNLYMANASNSVVQLTVNNGFRLSSGYTQIGSTSSGNATVNVSGTGSQLTAAALYASYSGSGTLAISNGGKVTSSSGNIGYNLGATGYVTVDGSGSQWIDSGNLSIGGSSSLTGAPGTGSLTITNGGKVTNTSGTIGYSDSATGTVSVTGTGSQWISSGSLYVGYMGKGTLTIANGASVTSAGAGIYGLGSAANQGSVSLSGTGSSWSNTGALALSGYGSGAYVNLTLGAGATLQSTGLTTLSNAVVTQTGGTFSTGGGLKFNNGTTTYHLQGGTLQVGGTNGILSGTGTYAFDLSGGTLQVVGTNLTTAVNATFASATNTTLDTNALGATWSGVLSGAGALTKSGTGTLTLSGVNTYTGGTTVSVGTLALGGDNALSSSTALTVASTGTLAVGTAYANAGSLAGSGLITYNGGALTVGADNTHTTFAGTLSGSGGLTKIGSGTLTLSGTGGGTYTIVTSGKLIVANAGGQSAVGSDTLSVGTSATLAGAGLIDASTSTIQGTLAPGDAGIGSLTFNHALTLASTSTLALELASAASYDQLVLGGAFTTGGTLQVDLLGGFTPTAGTTFHLFDLASPATGTFSALNLSALGTGLTWDTAQLYSAGNLVVAATAVPEPATYALWIGLTGLGLAARRRWQRGARD